MWGYLVTSVSILVWVMLAMTHQNVWNWLWFAIPVIGFTATPILARRQERNQGVTTYSDKITSQLQFLGGVDCWVAMLAYTLIAAPVAEIAQGLVIKEKALTTGGIFGLAIGLITICCVGGGVALDARWFMPLFIAAFVAMMIIPGHILNHKALKEK